LQKPVTPSLRLALSGETASLESNLRLINEPKGELAI